MDCNYQVVKSDNTEISDKHKWKPFLRQVHISSAVWTMFYLAGLSFGAPTVFIPQLRTESNHTIDDDLASWLYSISNFTAMPWVLILPSFTLYAGRKPIYILTCLSVSAAYSIMYFSTTPYEILVAGVIQGFANASNVTVMGLILIEYSSVKNRGIFLNVTMASCFWGIWTSNAIGTYFYWKYIPALGIICSAYTFTIVFCPESPVWLASKGKYKKSEEAFKWLNGDSGDSMKELQDVIKSQKNYQESIDKHLSLYATFKRKEFYKPLLLCILIGAQYHFSGKYVCSAYAIEVISKMTDNLSTAHIGMLVLDAITIFGMYFGIFLSRILKRRTLYYSSAFMGIIFLLIISLYLYLVRLSVLNERNIVTVILLVGYSLSISCGSMVLGYSMSCEIIPLEYQRSIYVIFSLSLFGITSIMLKLVPMAFKHLGVHGMFFFNGVTCGIFTVVLFIYLPDTQGKSVLEIEEMFKDKQESINLYVNKHLVKT